MRFDTMFRPQSEAMIQRVVNKTCTQKTTLHSLVRTPNDTAREVKDVYSNFERKRFRLGKPENLAMVHGHGRSHDVTQLTEMILHYKI